MAVRFSENFSALAVGEVANAANTAFNETVGTATMTVVAGTLGNAVRMDTDGTAGFAGLRYNHGTTAPTTRWYRTVLTPRRLPPAGAGHLFYTVRSGANISSGVRILDSGLIHLRNGTTNQNSAGQITTTPAGIGTPWRVEYRADAATLTHTARIFRGDLYGTTPTEVITAPLTTAGNSLTIGASSIEHSAMDFEAIVADDADWPAPPTAPPAGTAYVLETWGVPA